MGQRYQTEVFGQESELRADRVYGVAEDRDGRIWLGTPSGLVVYDSNDWRLFSNAGDNNIDSIGHLVVDERNYLWALVRGEQLRVVHGPVHEEQWTLTTGPEASINQASLVDVTYMQGEPVIAVRASGQGLWLFQQGQWQHLRGGRDLAGDKVLDLRAHNGAFYVATDQGLTVITGKGPDHRFHDLLPEDRRIIGALHLSGSGTNLVVWLLGEGWLGRIQDGQFYLLDTIPPFSNTFQYELARLLPDGQGGVFFGFETLLVHHPGDGSPSRRLKRHNGFAANGIHHMIKDWEGNFWFTSLSGVTKLSSLRFLSYDKSVGLFDNEVTAVVETAPGEFVFGHNFGITRYDGESFHQIKLPLDDPFLTHRVMDLDLHPDGTLWMALLNAGVGRLDQDDQVSHFFVAEDQFVSTVKVDTHGDIWAGGTFGVARLEEGEFRIQQDPVLNKTVVRRLHLGRDGNLYAATIRNGILMRTSTWEKLVTRPPLPSLFSVYQDKQGQLWAGGGDGLYRFGEGGLTKVESKSFTNDDAVFFILEDRRGRMWLGHDNGVRVWDGQKAQHYTRAHGLVGLETNRDGGMVSSAGEVWIGTEKGISYYREAYDQDPPPPKLSLGSVWVNGEPYSLRSPVILGHDQNNLVFETRAVSFIKQGKNRMELFLEGFDTEWRILEDRLAYYTNMPPGDYRLLARARNALGVSSETYSSAPLHIRRPYWATWWFRIVALLSMAGLIFLMARSLTYRRYSQVLEGEVSRRTRRIESLNQDLKDLNDRLEYRVEERTKALQTAQKELVESAHHAGMAEIANSILHNVGNILNSVNTSAYLLRDMLTRSKQESLEKANALLAEREHVLAPLFEHDPKGKMLLQFYPSLEHALQKERVEQRKRIDDLLVKIDMIKEVVAQHHNYASGVSQTERQSIQEMVEVALKILESGMEKRNIRIVKDYEPLPAVFLQKTKFIHILVNILKNAMESIEQEAPEIATISIRLFREERQAVLSITDNGGGISEENLIKIFSHGFTTKPSGNGFGLHSCATSIQDMDGSIQADSEGEGKGAVFILTLPLSR